MKKSIKRLFLSGLAAFILAPTSLLAAGGNVHLDKAPVDLHDKASLRNGARYFMNYCYGCHALELSRYNRVASDMGIAMEATEAEALGYDEALAKELVDVNSQTIASSLVFTRDEDGKPSNLGSLMKNAMPKKDAAKWFGAAPPDLSLSGRLRGGDWIYSYLRSFYLDPKKPSGVNNTVFPDVSMPHVLWKLQGWQEKDEDGHLHLKESGTLTPVEYDRVIGDITNFLVYVAEPVQKDRTTYGIYVMIFLSIFFILTYLLKKEYWKDIH